MERIQDIEKQTDNQYLNMYYLKGKNKKGGDVRYYVASRAKQIERLKIKSRKNTPDGVIIYSLYGEQKDKVVLVRQYRYSVDDYVYEFPAGLVEPGEDYRSAGVRELKEETGLNLELFDADEMFEKPGFTTIGMTDESCATIYGYAHGAISKEGQEDSEDMEIVIADKEEVKRILKEEHISIMCAYMLMHFLKTDDPFSFLK